MNKNTMKFKNLLLALAFAFILINETRAQRDTIDFYDASGVHLELLGPALFGVNGNYYLNNRIAFSLGFGFDLDVHLGVNLKLISRERSNHSVYLSTQFCMIRELKKPLYSNLSSGNKQLGLFIPLGYEFVGKNGFTLQLECGPNFVSEDYGQTNTKPVMYLLRIGKTFGFR